MRCWRCGARNPVAAAFCVECQADLTPRSPLSHSLKHAIPKRARAEAPSAPNMWLALGVSLALALTLSLAGFGAVRAAGLLEYAMRAAGPADVAATICAAYTTQKYDLLTRQLDSSGADALNPAAVQTQLRALDKIDGGGK